MSIDTQTGISQAQSFLRNKTATSSKSEGELGKGDFMNLFLTQMSNQNPVDPMDSGAMMSQLAQLGTMEQLENLNNQMKDLNKTQNNISRYQSIQFLDKDVMTETETVQISKGSSKPVYYKLDQDADRLKVIVEDMDGVPIFNQQIGLTTAGKHQFLWDGKNNEGTLMSDGKYKIRFQAVDEQGNHSTINAFDSGKVSQVEYRDGKPWLKTQNETIPLSNVKSVDIFSKRTFGNAVPLPLIHDLSPKEAKTSVKDVKIQ